MSAPTVFMFPWTKAPLSLNYRLHKMQEANIIKRIRGEMAIRGRELPRMERCEVVLTWVVNDRRKRDEENVVPVLKALCDGLVDAGVVPDDVPAYMVKRMPAIRYARKADEVAHFELAVTAGDRMSAPKVILQLCADTGSDTWPYRSDPAYEVITIGADIGVENYHPDRPIHGIIANPVCTEFSTLRRHPKLRDSRPEDGMVLVRECQRVIAEANPAWWAIENPATGSLRQYLGAPQLSYQPWQYGSPWTKRTALWGKFTTPAPLYSTWDDVPKYPLPHVRPNRRPSLAFMHKSAFKWIPEFRDSGMPAPTTDAELRSLCSQGFAHAFKAVNP